MSDVTHWIVWNIPATATSLLENVPAAPKMDNGAIQGKNIRGVNGYQGPCPPPGKPHHYTFELYVLDNTLDLGPDASRADVHESDGRTHHRQSRLRRDSFTGNCGARCASNIPAGRTEA